MTAEQFEQAVRSLGFGQFTDAEPYFGVVGLFGGNPALSPAFADYCAILRKLVPFEQRGIWCNNPITLDKAQMMAQTFDPSVSNLNVHLDELAYSLFKAGWPGCHPVGLHEDSRHSPPFVAMKDVITKPCLDCDGTGTFEITDDDKQPCEECHGGGTVPDADRIYELISTCDINQHWSAMIGVFRGELRAWFCEVAGAQAILHQHEPDYPDTGLQIVGEGRGRQWSKETGEWSDYPWWKCDMFTFRHQVRKHCFDCGVPLRGYGQLSQTPAGFEQTSATHESVYKPKTKDRKVELVTNLVQLEMGRIQKVNHYMQNAKL
jgi:hypothetical protein